MKEFVKKYKLIIIGVVLVSAVLLFAFLCGGSVEEAKKAVDEGYKLIGYIYWSIMDNYEWAEGYDPRFGLIYVDYRTQKRTLKDSAYWYKEVIASNGANL